MRENKLGTSTGKIISTFMNYMGLTERKRKFLFKNIGCKSSELFLTYSPDCLQAPSYLPTLQGRCRQSGEECTNMLYKETTHSATMYQSKHLTILFPPLMKMVTALEFWHCSMRSILSLVVPKEISLTTPAKPSFSAVSSQKRGTMRPPVAMAINCSETAAT